MANPTEKVSDAGFLSDKVRTHRQVQLTAKAIGADALAPLLQARVKESGTYADTAQYTLLQNVVERGAVADALKLHAQPHVKLRATGRLADGLRTGRSVQLAAAGQLADGVQLGRSVRVLEALTASETWRPLRHPSTRVSDTGRLHDALAAAQPGRLRAAGTLGDALRVHRRVHLADAARGADAWRALRHPSLRVVDTGHGSDAQRLHVQAQQRVVEALFGADHVRLPNDGDAWTANTDTWAMSRYTGVALNSVAVVDGVLMGAGDAGLYRLEGADDAGTVIDAWATTGPLDAGSDALKRVSAVYAAGTSEGAMELQVTAPTSRWDSQRYVYPFEDRWGDVAVNARAKVGRGLQARYWTFRIGNVAGAAFALESAAVLYTPLSRRF